MTKNENAEKKADEKPVKKPEFQECKCKKCGATFRTSDKVPACTNCGSTLCMCKPWKNPEENKP